MRWPSRSEGGSHVTGRAWRRWLAVAGLTGALGTAGQAPAQPAVARAAQAGPAGLHAASAAAPVSSVPAGVAPAAGGASAASAASAITAVQQRWLAAHAPVRFGAERDYGPFVYRLPDGRLAGLSVDMLRLVQARTGMVVLEQPAAPLHELLDAARARRTDLLSSLRPTPERARFLRFTQPYVSVPTVLVRRTADPVRPLAELSEVPVAVGRGYAVEAVMRQRHPAVHWMPMSDDGQSLAALLRGEVQAVVADAASVAFLVRSRGLQGLRIDAPVGFDYALSFAVRDDWPELVDIVNRAIQHIGPHERQRVLDRWLEPAAAVPQGWRSGRALAWGLGLLGLSLLLAAGLWLRRHPRLARRAIGRRPASPRPDGMDRHA